MQRKEGRGVESPGSIQFGNRFLSVRVKTSDGLQPERLFSEHFDLVLADRPYLYRVRKGWETPAFLGFRQDRKRDDLTLILEGEIGPLRISHEFKASPAEPRIDEVLTVENRGSELIETPDLAMGFARSMDCRDEDVSRVVSVPFRRDLRGSRGEYQEYPLRDIPMNRGFYSPAWPRRELTRELGAEGWIWESGKASLLVAKHSPEMMEFSILSPERLGQKHVLRFGGASIWHGDPEEGTVLKPGRPIRFSTTRYVLFRGGINEGYRAFRTYMESLGHGTPPGFNPPVHWNELYDNPLWWDRDTFENRRKLYTLAHMEEEAAKAREIGCESLYLDPGWDTVFGSSIWPAYRLREAREFVKLMGDRYGLKVSLHMPLAAWCDVTTYPMEAHRRDADGNLLEGLCSASPAYLEAKKQRLLDLAKAGFAYYMFDGSGYPGPCWDPSHGHSLPLRRAEHCKAILGLAHAVHKEHPDLIIELHDPILAGVPERYAPMHYLHGVGPSFDEGWAFEYMWDPMEDLISGRAISLYYYNLAYSLPLYLHIDLRKDNSNALEFWWYASTCRHLGIGGKHRNGDVWEAHKKAMRTYLRLKRLYTQGIFVGLDEEVHLHYMPGEKRAVINFFNLDSRWMAKRAVVDLSDIGFQGVSEVTDGKWSVDGGILSVRIGLEPRSAKVVEIVSA